MERNCLRIVRNSSAGTISYYFKNEIGEWSAVSSYSPLSRREFTNVAIECNCKDIVDEINKIYNRKNKGLDIYFEGSANEYAILRKEIESKNESLFSTEKSNYELQGQIRLFQGACKIVVVGKKSSGKTTLIKAVEKLNGSNFEMETHDGYTTYTDKINQNVWYEIDGIQLNLESIEATNKTIEKIIGSNAAFIVYCLRSTTGKVEKAEENLIFDLLGKYPALEATIALTMSINGKKENFIELEKELKQLKLIPILASDYEIDDEGNVKKAFGINDLLKFIFERR